MEIIQKAVQEHAAIITLDSDFHSILASTNEENTSVIRIRIEGLKAKALSEIIVNTISVTKREIEEGSAISVTEKGIRIHKLPLVYVAGETDTYYYYHDHLGSVIMATYENGDRVRQQGYLPFGETTGAAGLVDDEALFTGKDLDPDTGLYYFNARWYDPQLGRFISEDPIKDGPNWYVYCGNNPLVLVDPTGMYTDYSKMMGNNVTAETFEEAQYDELVYDIEVGDHAYIYDTEANLISGYIVIDKDKEYLNDLFFGGGYSNKLKLGDGELLMDIQHFCDVASDIAWIEQKNSSDPISWLFFGFKGIFYEAGALLFPKTYDDVLISLGSGIIALESQALLNSYASRFTDDVATTRGGVISADDLLHSATIQSKGGVSPVGRALQKHSARAGSAFSGATGNSAANTAKGMEYLKNILENGTRTTATHPTFGDVIKVRLSDGTGAWWKSDGSFIGFLQPFTEK